MPWYYSISRDELNREIDEMLAEPQTLAGRLRCLVKRTPFVIWLNVAMWLWIAFAWTSGWREMFLCLLPVAWWLWMLWPLTKRKSV